MKPRKLNTSSSIRQCCRGTCNENENPVSKEPKQVPAAETCNKFYHLVFSRVDNNCIFNALIVDQTIKSVRLPDLSIKNIAKVVDIICKRKMLDFQDGSIHQSCIQNAGFRGKNLYNCQCYISSFR